jgi:hypothetical protein
VAVTPAVSAYRLLTGLLLGGVLGVVYSFLLLPGEKHRHLMDLLFSAVSVWVWLYHSFSVCCGDIRVVYLLGMLTGLLLWKATAGTWLMPVFGVFWKFIGAVLGVFLFPWKKFLYFSKILFASVEKWVTIESTKIFKSRKKRRKDTHDPEKHPAQKSESGSSSRIQYP